MGLAVMDSSTIERLEFQKSPSGLTHQSKNNKRMQKDNGVLSWKKLEQMSCLRPEKLKEFKRQKKGD